MRALILSDIHANLDALEAVLAAAPAHDAVWNLGDIVGYGACPNEVIDRVRALGEVFVRGNHDRACTGLLSLDEFNPIAASAVQWTRDALSEPRAAWLRALPRGPVTPPGAQQTVSCMHGSLADEDVYIISVEDAIEPLLRAPTPISFFGHTHLQGGFATDGDQWYELRPVFVTVSDAEEYTLELRHGARYLLNPGSVGQPRDRDWRAGFALYDDAASTLRFFRVPYDVQSAQQRILNAGLPDILATRLATGR